MSEIPVPPNRNAKRHQDSSDESTEQKIVLRLKRGMYVGLGCPDPETRSREDDHGYGYTHDHPARVTFKDVPHYVEDGSGNRAYKYTEEVYESGELIQLWPPLEHEKAQIAEMKAKDKRFTFSLKEAQKRATQMVKDGVAEWA